MLLYLVILFCYLDTSQCEYYYLYVVRCVVGDCATLLVGLNRILESNLKPPPTAAYIFEDEQKFLAADGVNV